MDKTSVNNLIQKTQRLWEEKKELCELWRQSGKSKRQFCEENTISLATFCNWCDRLWPRVNQETNNVLPIAIKDASKTCKNEITEEILLEMIFPNQVKLRFSYATKNIIPLIQEICDAATIIR